MSNKTTNDYQKYIEESKYALIDAEDELLRLEKELEKQTRVTYGLVHEKDTNQMELDRLAQEYHELDRELKQLTFAFEEK